VAGEKELPDGSTPERRESWSNVVQLEVVTAADSNAVDGPFGPAWPALAPANAGDPATPATRSPTEAVVRSRRALNFEWKGTLPLLHGGPPPGQFRDADGATVLEQLLTSSRGPERRPSCSPLRAGAESP
jgi:hypothetical protein